MKQYFQNLNYTLANEDTSVEYHILPKNAQHLVAIAGAGSRILPLFAKQPKRVTCVDISLSQLYLTELRIESMRTLTHQQYMAFWGYPPYSSTPEERKKVFQKIQLSNNARDFSTQLFEQYNWESILYIGKWERTFVKLSKVVRFCMGDYSRKLFAYTNEKGYFDFIEKNFPEKRLSLLTFLLGNASIFNLLLYKGSFPKKNTPGSMKEFYYDSFKTLLLQGLPRMNFFLQIVFFGKLLYAEGNPIECNEGIYNSAKKGIESAKIIYSCEDFFEQIAKTSISPDFISLSDIVSYFDTNLEKIYLQKIKNNLAKKCIIVERHYIRIIQNVETSGYKDISSNFTDGINKEKVQMYNIKVLEKI